MKRPSLYRKLWLVGERNIKGDYSCGTLCIENRKPYVKFANNEQSEKFDRLVEEENENK